ncbi:MAG: hypothetical protein KKD98_05690 [Candidatus Thermoplasmatota archaeon]|nr:hypothetical protein [Candidatus Thermoplasmatota archaeon]
MSSQVIDTCAPGAKKEGVRLKELSDIVNEHDTYVKCKKCGSAGARIHSEEWSDGLVYVDYGCSACGYCEVYE